VLVLVLVVRHKTDNQNETLDRKRNYCNEKMKQRLPPGGAKSTKFKVSWKGRRRMITRDYPSDV
jgi:hypothetical protein